MTRSIAVRSLPAALLASSLLSGCLSKDPENPVVPAEERGIGRVLNADGSPAAGAQVRIIPVNHIPQEALQKKSAAIYEAETDADGRYSLEDVPEGEYNIVSSKDGEVSLQDSVDVDEDIVMKPDTLREPGGISGRIVMEPNHNPSTVTVQLLGTTVFVSTDTAGRFNILALPEGDYSARVTTIVPEYTARFTGFQVKAGKISEIREPIRLNYVGIPNVTGLRVTYDTAQGVARISWRRSDYANLLGYSVLRDPNLSPNISGFPLNHSRIVDTAYLDTLWKPADYRESVGDIQAWEYRVMVQAKDGAYGKWHESASLIAPSPAHVRTHIGLTWLGTQGHEASIGDTVQLVAAFENPTRLNRSLAWYVGDSLVRRLDLEGKRGADTLRIIGPPTPKVGWMECRITDAGGSVWTKSDAVAFLTDAPKADAGPDFQGPVGGKAVLVGKATDRFGRIVKREWNVGPAGAFIEVEADSLVLDLPATPARDFRYILRVTDDDGQVGLDEKIVNVHGLVRRADRPVRLNENIPWRHMPYSIAALDGKIVMIGGPSNKQLSMTVYDTATHAWQIKNNAPGLGELRIMSGKIHMVTSTGLWEYAPAQDAWNPMKPPQVLPTVGPIKTVMLGGKLVLLGGNRDDQLETQIYDPTTDTWSLSNPIPRWNTRPPTGPMAQNGWHGGPEPVVAFQDGLLAFYLNGQLFSWKASDPLWREEKHNLPAFIQTWIPTHALYKSNGNLGFISEYHQDIGSYEVATGAWKVTGQLPYNDRETFDVAFSIHQVGDAPISSASIPQEWISTTTILPRINGRAMPVSTFAPRTGGTCRNSYPSKWAANSIC